MKKPGNIAIVVVGPVTAGKSSISEYLHKEHDIPLISESTKGNYYKILDHINPYVFPMAVYDHCWIYKKWFMFKSLYKHSFILVVNPSNEVLLDNYKARMEESTEGDFINIDPIEQKNVIIHDITEIRKLYDEDPNHVIKILDITSSKDYPDIQKQIERITGLVT